MKFLFIVSSIFFLLNLQLVFAEPDSTPPTTQTPGFCGRIIKRLGESIRVLKPKLGLATYKGNGYDVRVISKGIIRLPFVPSEVESHIQKLMNTQLAALSEMGIAVQPFIHVIAEGEPGLLANKDGNYDFLKESVFSPAMADSAIGISFPGLIGRKGFSAHGGNELVTQNRDQVLVIPNLNGHLMATPNIVAHELGHKIKHFDAHPSVMWAEARSDAIAYLLTGEPKVESPTPLEIRQMDKNGVEKKVRLKILRDIARPKINNVSNLIPSIRYYHENSQIMSHLLYQVGQKLGRDRMISLLKYIDSQREIALREFDDPKTTEKMTEMALEMVMNGITATFS